MAVKAFNFKIEESDIYEMKKVASAYHMTMTDVVKEAVREYLEKMKKDPFYRLTANIEEASDEESAEIMDTMEGLSDDDLTIALVKHFDV